MKKPVFLAIILFISFAAWAQASNDKRGFQGTVVAELKDRQPTRTEIQFTGRTIVIGSDTYDIVKKEYDGKAKTTFTCTKRRGTYEIAFVAGRSITITDQANREAAIVYSSLQDK